MGERGRQSDMPDAKSDVRAFTKIHGGLREMESLRCCFRGCTPAEGYSSGAFIGKLARFLGVWHVVRGGR